MTTKIEGVCSCHRVITKRCRELKDDEIVVKEVVGIIEENLRAVLENWPKEKSPNIHVAVTVEC